MKSAEKIVDSKIDKIADKFKHSEHSKVSKDISKDISKHRSKDKSLSIGSSKTPKKGSFLKSLFGILIIMAVFFFGWKFFHSSIILFLKQFPFVWGIISHIASNISNLTWLGLIYLSYFGGLFFVFLPVEGSFLLYILNGKNPAIAIVLAVSFYSLGLATDYFFGFLFGKGFIRFFLKDKFEKTEKRFEKWGSGIIVFGNIIFPFPIQLLSVMYGAFRFPFKKFIFLSLIGELIKFTSLFFGFNYFGGFFDSLKEKAVGFFGKISFL